MTMILSCRHSFPLFKRVTALAGRKEISGGVVACNNNRLEWFSTSDIFISSKQEKKNGFSLSSSSSFMLLPLLFPVLSSTISTTKKTITEESKKSMFDNTDNVMLSLDPFVENSTTIGNVDVFGDDYDDDELCSSMNNNNSIWTMNRNARRPKKANKGARPCSRASRRRKKEKIGKRRR